MFEGLKGELAEIFYKVAAPNNLAKAKGLKRVAQLWKGDRYSALAKAGRRNLFGRGLSEPPPSLKRTDLPAYEKKMSDLARIRNKIQARGNSLMSELQAEEAAIDKAYKRVIAGSLGTGGAALYGAGYGTARGVDAIKRNKDK